MTSYTITNGTNGHCLGLYEGANESEALDAMRADCGDDDLDTSDLRVDEVEVELDSPVGPRVLVCSTVGSRAGEVQPEHLLAALPAGWTIHEDDFSNAVKTSRNRWSFPLSRA